MEIQRRNSIRPRVSLSHEGDETFAIKDIDLNLDKKNVALFGGSFDPITIAHLQIGSEIYNQFDDIDEVWLLPCGDGREDKNLTLGIHRVEMIKLILKDSLFSDVPLKVEDIEIRNKKYLPTYELLGILKETYKDCRYFFCIGSDLLKGIRNWKPDGDKLVKEYDFIIMTRPNYIIEKEYLPDSYKIINTHIDGSSTNIRERISNFCLKLTAGIEQFNDKRKKYLAINGLTTLSVIDYIIKNQLYMDEECYRRIICHAEKEKELLEVTKAKSSNNLDIHPKFLKIKKEDSVDSAKDDKKVIEEYKEENNIEEEKIEKIFG